MCESELELVVLVVLVSTGGTATRRYRTKAASRSSGRCPSIPRSIQIQPPLESVRQGLSHI